MYHKCKDFVKQNFSEVRKSFLWHGLAENHPDISLEIIDEMALEDEEDDNVTSTV